MTDATLKAIHGLTDQWWTEVMETATFVNVKPESFYSLKSAFAQGAAAMHEAIKSGRAPA